MMDGRHKVRIKKYKNGTDRVFLDGREVENVGKYSIVSSKDGKSDFSVLNLELINVKGIIIEEEE